ncbi:MAG: hypothetical protein K6C07_07590, partial [Bacteroidales bacterium]|nr:hypothetical protein [Bacteroidales bacterium]
LPEGRKVVSGFNNVKRRIVKILQQWVRPFPFHGAYQFLKMQISEKMGYPDAVGQKICFFMQKRRNRVQKTIIFAPAKKALFIFKTI